MPSDSAPEQLNMPLGDEPATADAIGEPAPAAPPPPQYVTETQMKEGLERILERVGSLVQGALLRNQAAPAPTPPVRPEFNLNELEDDIRQGREGTAARLDALIADRVERGVQKALGAVDALSSVGLSNMEQLARESAARDKDPKMIKRFGKEWNDFMATVAPEARASVDSWKRGWAYVVGQHYDELVVEEREMARRAATERTPQVREAALRSSRIREDGSQIPSFEEWAGPEGLGALSEKPRGARDGDEYAKQMGYRNWPEFYTARVEPYERMDINEYMTPREYRAQGYDDYRDMIDAKTKQGKYAPARNAPSRGH